MTTTTAAGSTRMKAILRLQRHASKVVRKAGTAEDLDRILAADRAARLALMETYLAQVRRDEMRDGGGHSRSAASHNAATPAVAQQNGEPAGHSSVTNRQSRVTRHLPGHPKPFSAATKRMGAIVMASSVFNHRTTDGRLIGDFSRLDLARHERRSFRDAHLCRLLLRHIAPSPATDGKPLRDYLPEAELERMIQQAAELADAT